ncbi:MAG TPA: hypothetical protein VGZ24_03420 [Chthoniobacterales bacterium]|jgi:hypothetical protein|nr:hypothetical protein [Chthoniobacterales bacterium]
MKKLAVAFCAMAALASAAFAGPEYSGKETKQVAPPPCPQWYADNEFNVSLWGTYLFTGTDSANDRYVEADHAWGGGLDLKYFFRRYFGIGVEGWGAEATRHQFDGSSLHSDFVPMFSEDSRAIGSVLGTFTLRYPISCTRFAPYIWAGGGAIFGGGQRDGRFQGISIPEVRLATHSGSTTEAIVQFGGGIEIRITPHIGWLNDFSWNVVDGPDNNFGMVRSGVTFAF